MGESTDLLFGSPSTVTAPPPSSNTDILFGAPPATSSPTTTPAPPPLPAPGSIDPITGLRVQFADTGGKDPVAASTGTPVAEPAGSQVGLGLQMKLATSDDPEQRRRIAAASLYPDLPPKEALSRMFYGDNGRLATVDAKGNPYFIDPAPVFAGSDPYSPSSLVTPYSRDSFSSPNLAAHEAAAVPGLIGNAFTAGGQMVGGPLGAGAASAVSDAARYLAARYFDPDANKGPSFDWAGMVTNALTTAGALKVGDIALRTDVPKVPLPPGPRATTPAPTAPTVFGRNEPPLPTTFTSNPFAPGFSPGQVDIHGGVDVHGGDTVFETVPGSGPVSDNPLVLRQSQMGPNPLLPAGPTPTSPGVPGAPKAAEVQLNPAGEAAHTSGPYAPSSPAEVGTIPDALPPQRIPILTQSQANARADAIIQHFAANGPKDFDASVNVPGSVPTLAQGTGNAGLATLERGMRNNPDVANIFDSVDTAQQQARQQALRNLVGTPDDLAAAVAARGKATSALRDKAFAPDNIKPTDASDAVAEIDKVLTGPEGGRTAVTGPLAKLRAGFFNPDGTPITDPATLYQSTRKNITDALSPLSRGTDADATAASSILQRVLPKLDTAIEAGAPGYQDYMNAFRDQSGPVNAMQYLQGRNLTDAYGNTTLQKLDSTIKDVQRQQAMPGARSADSLSDDQMAQLDALRTDHLRSANLAKGKALGSNTVQNLSTNTVMNALTGTASQVAGRAAGAIFGHVPGYLVAEGAERGLSAAAANAERMTRQAVVDRLLNKGGSGVAALGGTPAP